MNKYGGNSGTGGQNTGSNTFLHITEMVECDDKNKTIFLNMLKLSNIPSFKAVVSRISVLHFRSFFVSSVRNESASIECRV